MNDDTVSGCAAAGGTTTAHTMGPRRHPVLWSSLALLLCSVAFAAQAGGLSTATCNITPVQTSSQFATALATPDADVLQLAGPSPAASACCVCRAHAVRFFFVPCRWTPSCCATQER